MPLKNKKIRIAIADDHKSIRDTVCFTVNIFAKDKMEVVVNVDNGKDLFKELGEKKAEVLILDLQMPDVNGEATVRLLRKKFPKVKIIIFTFHRGWDEADGLIRAGARAFMTKDYGHEHILESIYAVMNGEIYMRNPRINFHEKLPEEKKLKLIKREKRVLELLAQSKKTAEIAQQLDVSKRTVEYHKSNLYRKTDTKTLAGLMSYATAIGWVKV